MDTNALAVLAQDISGGGPAAMLAVSPNADDGPGLIALCGLITIDSLGTAVW